MLHVPARALELPRRARSFRFGSRLGRGPSHGRGAHRRRRGGHAAVWTRLERSDVLAALARWGTWRGRESELFVACAKIAAPLQWPDIQRLGGARLQLLSRLLVESYETLVSDVVPLRVRRRQLNVVYTSSESARVVGYSPMDPLRVPKTLLDVLHHFDGRPTGAVIEEIHEQHGLKIAPGVVRQLVDFDLLSTT